jgi:hypothetical protein
MQHIGHIARLQLQRASAKSGEKPNQIYTTDHLSMVDALLLSSEGLSLDAPHGSPLLDIHNALHPDTRYSAKSRNAVSFNFDAHYTHMRAHYGAHAVTGCAGENVLVALSAGIAPADVTAVFDGGIHIALDGGAFAHITDVRVALPCAPFSRWILRDEAPDAQTLKETLRFLDNGVRGYYAAYAGAPVTLRVGAAVFLA